MKKQVDRNCCKHVFEIMREASANTTEGHGGEMHPAVSKCKKCELMLETSVAILHDAYQNQARATAVLILTTIISILTLGVTSLSFYLDSISLPTILIDKLRDKE